MFSPGVHAIRYFLVDSQVLVGLAQVARLQRLNDYPLLQRAEYPTSIPRLDNPRRKRFRMSDLPLANANPCMLKVAGAVFS
jgi:hypothetical protein